MENTAKNGCEFFIENQIIEKKIYRKENMEEYK